MKKYLILFFSAIILASCGTQQMFVDSVYEPEHNSRVLHRGTKYLVDGITFTSIRNATEYAGKVENYEKTLEELKTEVRVLRQANANTAERANQKYETLTEEINRLKLRETYADRTTTEPSTPSYRTTANSYSTTPASTTSYSSGTSSSTKSTSGASSYRYKSTSSKSSYTPSYSGSTYVRGHYRTTKSGKRTYVRGHYRRK